MSGFADILLGTLRDVVPIAATIFGFQVFFLRATLARPGRIALGLVYVLLGLALFLLGLEKALFPLGRAMAEQLTHPAFLAHADVDGAPSWHQYGWVYAFAFAIGLSTTIAEPALIAIALKAAYVSGGAVSAFGLRIAVALGVAVGIALGTVRIVTGLPLPLFIIAGYAVVMIQTFFAPREMIPLAYDSGGVTTSTVTVPLVAALGLGLADAVPGRDPLLDGFGLVAFASLFPMITVMAYAQIPAYRARRRAAGSAPEKPQAEEDPRPEASPRRGE